MLYMLYIMSVVGYIYIYIYMCTSMLSQSEEDTKFECYSTLLLPAVPHWCDRKEHAGTCPPHSRSAPSDPPKPKSYHAGFTLILETEGTVRP